MADPARVMRYRPSNGTEGAVFMDRWCGQCKKDSEDNPCAIIGWTMAVDVDDPNYPKEWVRDDKGPRCTAYKPKTASLTAADVAYLAWKRDRDKRAAAAKGEG